MNDILIVTLLIVSLFGFLAGGVWVGLTLAGTAWLRRHDERQQVCSSHS